MPQRRHARGLDQLRQQVRRPEGELVYAGIDVASDAFLPILSQAGIPYVSSNSWGPAQKNDPNSHLLHTAAGAFTVAPLKTLKDLGIKKAAVVVENTPAGQDFLNNVVKPIGEQKLGLEIQTILVDPANADYASAVGTAQAGGAEAIWGQLTEPGCIGLATATNQLSFTGPVVVGSCTAYIQVLKDKAVGTYTSGDVFIPEIAQYTPADIQARLKTYTDNMTAAGQQQYINGFAVAPYSGMFELTSILVHHPGRRRSTGPPSTRRSPMPRRRRATSVRICTAASRPGPPRSRTAGPTS